ncbi:pH-response transcription factor pacC/RIM101 [Cryomyces antarcticus]
MSTDTASAAGGASAGAATTQQQTPAAQPATSSSTTIDSLTCQWQSCGERCNSAEELYDHVCERHVGRKSTNNLNLTCQWGACRTTTVKRDHITSHIRVHVPLKPHKCDFCGKAFKRPQDLKKHVKTHADDSVLLRSPEPPMRGSGTSNGFSASNGKLFADLQNVAATANGYYPNSSDLSTQNYAHHGSHNMPTSTSNFYSSGAQQASYGPVYYPMTASTYADAQSFETRKRAIDALNDFLGDAKRRAIDPSTYYDVRQRLGGGFGVQSLPLPMATDSYSGGGYSSQSTLPDYNSTMPTSMHTGHASHATLSQPQHYSLPALPNLRTKNDLVNIDQFLEQLQSTVYESMHHAAAAGVHQPGSHMYHTGMNTGFRASNSPPHLRHSSNAMTSNVSPHTSMSSASGMPASSSALDTPALTPASSVLSYNSSHSPTSAHFGSVHEVSPHSVNSRPNTQPMYPSLPVVSAMSDLSGYPATTSAPASGLATSFDYDARRYSGGRLQKAAMPVRQSSEDRMDTGSNAGTEKAVEKGADHEHEDGLAREADKLDIASPADSTASVETPSDRVQESWVENIRVIEALRAFIKDRLEKQEYDEDDEEEGERRGVSNEEEAEKGTSVDEVSYPTLRPIGA